MILSYYQYNFFNSMNIPKNIIDIMLSNSLTKKLQKNILPFSVNVIFIGEKKIYHDELKYFNNSFNKFYVREVDLLVGDIPVVKARSICYLNSNYWTRILNCGNNPLGIYLFNPQHKVVRSRWDFFWLNSRYPLLKLIKTDKIIARRSVFSINYIRNNQDKLLLTECFLDDLRNIYNY